MKPVVRDGMLEASEMQAIEDRIQNLKFMIKDLCDKVDARNVPLWKPDELAQASHYDYELAKLESILKHNRKP